MSRADAGWIASAKLPSPCNGGIGLSSDYNIVNKVRNRRIEAISDHNIIGATLRVTVPRETFSDPG